MHSVETSLMGAPDNPPDSTLYFDRSPDGRALVVFETIMPSIPVSNATWATSDISSREVRREFDEERSVGSVSVAGSEGGGEEVLEGLPFLEGAEAGGVGR